MLHTYASLSLGWKKKKGLVRLKCPHLFWEFRLWWEWKHDPLLPYSHMLVWKLKWILLKIADPNCWNSVLRLASFNVHLCLESLYIIYHRLIFKQAFDCKAVVDHVSTPHKCIFRTIQTASDPNLILPFHLCVFCNLCDSIMPRKEAKFLQLLRSLDS